jgi:predicted Zn-dependent peptidase
VGDVNTKDTLAKVAKYFDRIPAQPAPAPVDATEPPQTAERRQTIDDPLARLPRLDMVWHTPGAYTPDSDALGVLSLVLSSGRSSRFYDRIVRAQQLSSNVGASSAGTRGPGLFQVGAVALPGKTIEELERAIDAEIERVKTGPIEDWEIEKARNSQKRQYVAGLTSSLQRAVLLGQYALFANDPNLINTYIDRINAVTAADVQRVAKEYLVPTNRTVVVTSPKGAAGQGGGQ